MNHDIPLRYFDTADECVTRCTEPVIDTERTPLVHYSQLLLTRLMNDEEVNGEAQHEMVIEAGTSPVRIDEIVEFLSQWGNEQLFSYRRSVNIVVRIKRSLRIRLE